MAEGLRTWASRRVRSERGAELVEFAMVVPILLVIFAGIIDLSLMLQRSEVITNAAREGARLAVLPGYGQADVIARVNAYLDEGLTAGASANATTTMTAVPVAVATGSPVSARQVVVQYTASYTILGPMMSLIGGTDFGTITLTARASMRLEVPGP
jgi:Flp pilus assembly protein TadG